MDSRTLALMEDILSEFARLEDRQKQGIKLTPEEKERVSDLINADLTELNSNNALLEITKELNARTRGNPPDIAFLTGNGINSTASSPHRTSFLAGRSYRDMWGSKSLSNDGFRDLPDFILHAVEGRHPKLRAMSEKIGAEGGYLVPDQFAAEILDVALEDEIVRSRATVWPMMSETKKVPGFVIGSHSSHVYGGVVAKWAGEASTLEESEPSYRQLQLTAHKLTCYGIYSNEVSQDSAVPFQEVISRVTPKAARFFLDSAFLTSDGVGSPLGVKNSSCLISVARASANSISYIDLTNMLSKLWSGSFKNAIWLAHPTTIPQLLSLTITVGSGGSHYPVLSESNGEFRILSRPVIFTEKMSTLGDAFDLGLFDFSQYAIGMRQEMRMDFSQHLLFRSDQVAYRLILRVDGMPTWNEKLTLKDGTTTVSPFVSLAA